MDHDSIFLTDDGVHFLEIAAAFRKILPCMTSSAFFTFECGQRDRLCDAEQVPQVQGILPGRVLLTVSFDPDLLGPQLEFTEQFQAFLHFIACSDNASMQFHGLLQVRHQSIGIFAAIRIKRI